MSGAATGGRLSPAAAIGRDALRRVRRGMFVLVAAALCIATPAFADDGISGSATLFDLTFTNTTAFAYKGVSGLTLKFNSGVTPSYNNDNCDDSTGLYLKYTPWISGAHSTFNGLENFTLVVVGTMSSAKNTIFIHLGSSSNSGTTLYTGLLITSTDNDDEVLIAKNTYGNVDAANGVRVSVPNAASARHAYVIVKSGTTFTVWVDGVKRGSFTVPSGYKLGVNTHSGVQVGSDYGGEIKKAGVYNAVQSDDNSGVVNVIRVFDKVVSDAQMEAVFAAYPYVSKGGLYTRTVSADGTFSSTDAWAKDGESGAFAAPEGATVDGVYYNPSATLDVNAAATLRVNADIALDTLTVGGSEPLTFAADGTHALSVVGAAIVNSPVTNEYGAVNVSGAPVQLGSNGSICFDYSGFDISGIYETTSYQLTGLIEQDDTKVTFVAPPAVIARRVAFGYNETGSYYEFTVAPDREPGTVYWKSGVFAEGSSDLRVVTRDGEGIETETILLPGDTVVFDDSVAGANATVLFGETLPTGVNYYFSDNWTGTVIPEWIDTATTYIWTGANGDGNMNTDGNWYGNEAPSTGAVVYIPAAKTATIVNNIENFAPASITFGRYGSGQVTIGGSAIEGVAAITNLSLAVQTFNVPVSGTAIDFYNTSTHCAFRGGITLGSATFGGANTEAARALVGAWTFTDGDAYTWTPVENNRVMDNSSVTVEGQLLNPSNLVIDAGCVVTAATLKATHSVKSALINTDNGSLVVTGECRIDASADCYLAATADDSKENSATVEFGSYIANNSGGWPRINAKDIIVGAGGISNLVANSVVVLAGSPVLHSRTGEFSIDQSSSQSYYTANFSNTTTIDTTQYGTEDVPAEVTINARFHERNGNWPGGAMKVTGCGTVLFNSESTFTGGLTVTDTATVAVNPGKKPGAGTVTVNNGTTLQVAQSGTVALAGGLTLADGAALGFNFTGKQTAPVLNVTGKTVELGEKKNITVKVSAADGIRPKGGSYDLTSGGNFTGATVSLASDAPNWAGTVSVNDDGNIVLGVKSPGFLLIVK